MARSYIGTPFHMQGRLKGVGIDCVGLIVSVAKDLGVPIEDWVTYSKRDILRNSIIDRFDKVFFESEYAPGNIAVYSFQRAKRFSQHTAIITDTGIVHAHAEKKFVVEHPDIWKDKLVKVYTWQR